MKNTSVTNNIQLDDTNYINLYHKYPDFQTKIEEIPDHVIQKIKSKLAYLYGENNYEWVYSELERILKVHSAYKNDHFINGNLNDNFSENDMFLITYADLIYEKNKKPLRTLLEFASDHLKDIVNTVHILPFFPYSTDKGFSVIDFNQVDPELGTWQDIAELKVDFNLMFDCVFNHVSSKSNWFQEFLGGNKEYEDFFTVFNTTEEISKDHLELIIRPRTTELLTQFKTLNGTKFLWTTFSDDQIDLNYKNPKVLLKIIEIFLKYIRMGANILRLDAINYLWTEIGTSCSHLNQTHAIIRLFRDILKYVEPTVLIATETNVPMEDNIKYFGDGTDEANLIYNFSLPPLVLHTFFTGNSDKISQWASSLINPSNSTTYLNILDTHDGIGLSAAKDILNEDEIEKLILSAVQNGGFISYRHNEGNNISPYEINISWFNALNNQDSDETIDHQIKKFIASRSIPFVLRGIPGIYLHSFLGTENDVDSVLEERNRRSINRSIINKNRLIKSLDNSETTTHKIFNHLSKIIKIRTRQKSFHPNAGQQILELNRSLFSLIRKSIDGKEGIVCITNVTNKNVKINIDLKEIAIQTSEFQELISDEKFRTYGKYLSIDVEPYQILWLKYTQSFLKSD